jgi:hypothetical protein
LEPSQIYALDRLGLEWNPWEKKWITLICSKKSSVCTSPYTPALNSFSHQQEVLVLFEELLMGIVVVDLKQAGVNYNIEVATDVAVTPHDDMYWRQCFHHQIIMKRGLKVNPYALRWEFMIWFFQTHQNQ